MQMLAGKKMQLHTIIKVALRALMYRERFDNKTETFLKSYLNSYTLLVCVEQEKINKIEVSVSIFKFYLKKVSTSL